MLTWFLVFLAILPSLEDALERFADGVCKAQESREAGIVLGFDVQQTGDGLAGAVFREPHAQTDFFLRHAAVFRGLAQLFTHGCDGSRETFSSRHKSSLRKCSQMVKSGESGATASMVFQQFFLLLSSSQLHPFAGEQFL